jgi:hypothetical protein
MYVLAKRERRLSSAKKSWKTHPLCTRGLAYVSARKTNPKSDGSSKLRLKRDVVKFLGAVRSSPRGAKGAKGAVLPTTARIPRRISGFCQNMLLVFRVN